MSIIRKQLAVLSVAVLAFGLLTGCEKKTEGTEAPAAGEKAAEMKEGAAEGAKAAAEAAKAPEAPAAPAEAAPAAPAAGAAGGEALVGKWGIDLEATMAEDPNMKNMPEEQKAQAMQTAQAFLGTMSFEFTNDGKAIARMGDKEEIGNYTVKSTEGDTLTLEMKSGEGDMAKTEEMKIQVTGGKLIMSQGEQKMVLKKL
ncbi:MAG: hypothetical protein R3F65_10315 [bacterium]